MLFTSELVYTYNMIAGSSTLIPQALAMNRASKPGPQDRSPSSLKSVKQAGEANSPPGADPNEPPSSKAIAKQFSATEKRAASERFAYHAINFLNKPISYWNKSLCQALWRAMKEELEKGADPNSTIEYNGMKPNFLFALYDKIQSSTPNFWGNFKGLSEEQADFFKEAIETLAKYNIDLRKTGSIPCKSILVECLNLNSKKVIETLVKQGAAINQKCLEDLNAASYLPFHKAPKLKKEASEILNFLLNKNLCTKIHAEGFHRSLNLELERRPYKEIDKRYKSLLFSGKGNFLDHFNLNHKGLSKEAKAALKELLSEFLRPSGYIKLYNNGQLKNFGHDLKFANKFTQQIHNAANRKGGNIEDAARAIIREAQANGVY